MRRLGAVVVSAVSVLLLPPGVARADVLDVPGDFATIQAALAVAADGDEILVQPGLYNETLDTLGKTITLRSAGGSAVTTIDASGFDTTVIHVPAGAPTVEGFTITGGEGYAVSSNRHGGGLYFAAFSTGSVRQCRIVGNDVLSGGSSSSGGGAYAQLTVVVPPFFSGCDFEDNHAAYWGGGLYSGGAIDCRFTGNSAGFQGGGYYNNGVPDSPVGCTFEGNSATEGGGCYVNNNDNISLLDTCSFFGNTATGAGGGAVIYGKGGLPYEGGFARNCIFAGNADAFGAGLDFGNDMLFAWRVATGCTFVGDRPDGLSFVNDIFWSGAAPQSSFATVSHCDIEGGWIGAGVGNVDADPLFAAPGVDDFHLLPGSPCFNRGTESGFDDGDTDLDGQPRVQGGVPDIGADEQTEDCNGNGLADYLDLDSGASLDANDNGVPDECEGTWTELGGALAGSNGVPHLQGSGSLLGVHLVTLILSQAKKSGSATLVIGASAINLPFKGGLLVPALNVIVPGLPVTFSGSLILTALWPAGIPSGFTTYFQYWIADAAAVQGFSASNGLAAITP